MFVWIGLLVGILIDHMGKEMASEHGQENELYDCRPELEVAEEDGVGSFDV